MPSRIAYLVNQYPKVSHTFIRREILALERQGLEVQRIALRGWDATLPDPADQRERDNTVYVLRRGVFPLLASALMLFLTRPRRSFAALVLAMRMARRGGRLMYHLAYLAEACWVFRLLQSSPVGHVHAHFGTNSAEVAMLIHALGGPPYSFTVHGPEEFDDPQSLGLTEKVNRAAFVIAVSSFGRSQLFRWAAPEDWPKVKVVHCGLEFHEPLPAEFPASPRIVCVGRLCEQKGQLLLIEAATRLAAKGVPFDLVLAGDGELRGSIDALIQRQGLKNRVCVTGWISGEAVRREILAARALVLPSFAEGLPVVIMEAMALRRPVVATWVAGIPELVSHGETGWLCPAGDLDELVRALEKVLSASTDELKLMGEAGYARVRARHSIGASAATLAGLFAESAHA